MTKITGQEAIELLERAVAEKGADYVYPFKVESLTAQKGEEVRGWEDSTCAYYYNGQPSCIVGRVAHYLGVDVSHLEGSGSDSLGPILGLDGAALEALSAAQLAQDNGETWGEALKAAREALGDA